MIKDYKRLLGNCLTSKTIYDSGLSVISLQELLTNTVSIINKAPIKQSALGIDCALSPHMLVYPAFHAEECLTQSLSILVNIEYGCDLFHNLLPRVTLNAHMENIKRYLQQRICDSYSYKEYGENFDELFIHDIVYFLRNKAYKLGQVVKLHDNNMCSIDFINAQSKLEQTEVHRKNLRILAHYEIPGLMERQE